MDFIMGNEMMQIIEEIPVWEELKPKESDAEKQESNSLKEWFGNPSMLNGLNESELNYVEETWTNRPMPISESKASSKLTKRQ